MRRPAGPAVTGVVLATILAALSSCGLPSGGSAQRVDDDLVPYRLLESDSSSTGSPDADPRPGPGPVVFWVTGDRLLPEATDEDCRAPAVEVMERLLDTLTAGPSEDARAAGRSTAIPPDSRLELVDLVGGTAEVEFEPGATLSADRLPLAVGQLVLTLASAPDVDSVLLLSEGEPVQAPLPGGVLTDGPVRAEAYADLLPDRYVGSVGCVAG